MTKTLHLRVFASALFVLLVAAAAANAQATRTWVSGVGDDANPCSRTAPCKTFAGAISKTAPCGEIDVLDPGGFGALTITKCISIESEGVIAGVLVSGTNGFIVAAGASDNVVIRGLTFEGLGTGLAGIKVNSAGSVTVEHCYINNFTANGIDLNANSNMFVSIKDTVVRNNNNASNTSIGIYNHPSAGVTRAVLDDVRSEHNSVGVRADASGNVTIRNSEISNNAINGVSVGGGFVNLESTVAAFNGFGGPGTGNGISVASGTAVMSNTSALNNANGGVNNSGGSAISYQNNRFHGNGVLDVVGTLTTTTQQ